MLWSFWDQSGMDIDFERLLNQDRGWGNKTIRNRWNGQLRWNGQRLCMIRRSTTTIVYDLSNQDRDGHENNHSKSMQRQSVTNKKLKIKGPKKQNLQNQRQIN